MLSTLLAAAALTGVLDVADRTELRVRAQDPTSGVTAIDVESALTVRLLLGSRRLRYTLSYEPRLLAGEVNGPSRQTSHFQGGSTRLEWHDRRIRLSLEETASYGGVSLASLSMQPTLDGSSPRLDVIPTRRVLNLAATTTTLASRITHRRWTVDTAVGYQQSGGADAAARAFLPQQAGPFALLTAEWAASRRDRISTTLSASEVAFSSGSETVLIGASADLRRLVTRVVEARLSLGVTEAHVRPSAQGDYAFVTHPVVEIALDRRAARLEDQLQLHAGARLGPVINRQLGIVDERVQGTLGASVLHRRVTARAYLTGSHSVPGHDPFSTTLLAGEIGLGYTPSAWVTLDVGARCIWQRQVQLQASFLQGTLFAGVTFRAPPLRL